MSGTLELEVTADHAVPVTPAAGGTLTVLNQSGDTLYYGDTAQVSAANNQGSLTATQSVTLSLPQWIRSASLTTVQVTFIDPVAPSSGAGGSATISASTQSGNYTFALTDAGTVVEGTSASAQTFTVPPHASVAFGVGTLIEVFQDGAGQITIAAGVGVTLRSDAAKVNTAAQYATVSLRQRAQDEWVLSGDLI